MSWIRPVGYISLLFAGLLTLYLVSRQFGGDDTAASSTAATSDEPAALGDAPPDAVRTNTAAAKEYIERQHCLAACASEVKICTATADGADAMKRCNERKQTCEDECPGGD